MGMQLLNGLARSLEGNFELNSSATGKRVRFIFPAPLRTIQQATTEHPSLVACREFVRLHTRADAFRGTLSNRAGSFIPEVKSQQA